MHLGINYSRCLQRTRASDRCRLRLRGGAQTPSCSFARRTASRVHNYAKRNYYIRLNSLDVHLIGRRALIYIYFPLFFLLRIFTSIVEWMNAAFAQTMRGVWRCARALYHLPSVWSGMRDESVCVFLMCVSNKVHIIDNMSCAKFTLVSASSI